MRKIEIQHLYFGLQLAQKELFESIDILKRIEAMGSEENQYIGDQDLHLFISSLEDSIFHMKPLIKNAEKELNKRCTKGVLDFDHLD